MTPSRQVSQFFTQRHMTAGTSISLRSVVSCLFDSLVGELLGILPRHLFFVLFLVQVGVAEADEKLVQFRSRPYSRPYQRAQNAVPDGTARSGQSCARRNDTQLITSDDLLGTFHDPHVALYRILAERAQRFLVSRGFRRRRALWRGSGVRPGESLIECLEIWHHWRRYPTASLSFQRTARRIELPVMSGQPGSLFTMASSHATWNSHARDISAVVPALNQRPAVSRFVPPSRLQTRSACGIVVTMLVLFGVTVRYVNVQLPRVDASFQFMQSQPSSTISLPAIYLSLCTALSNREHCWCLPPGICLRH